MAPIDRSFGIADLAECADSARISKTVVVQTVADVSETIELLELAEDSPLIRAVVGYIDLTADDVGWQLDSMAEGRGGVHLAGVRNLVQDEVDPEWLMQPVVVAGLREVAARDLGYDLLIRADQLRGAERVVREVADCRFVVDHLAKPAIASDAWEPWATDLEALASHPNVWCKLSGLVTEADWQAWSLDDLRPYAEHALTVFGPKRVMFGSDWPVCTLAASYSRVVDTAEELLGALTDAERSMVFGGTATSFYRLDDELA